MNTDRSLDLSLEQRGELNDIAFQIIGAGYQVNFGRPRLQVARFAWKV